MFFETRIVLERDEIQEVIPYPVVVEKFANGMTPSMKRNFELIFNREERKKCREFYSTLSGWYLKTGVPDKYKLLKADYDVLMRFCNFATNKGIFVGR